jgi:hypothetical protein
MTLGVLLGDHRVGLARAGKDRRFLFSSKNVVNNSNTYAYLF